MTTEPYTLTINLEGEYAALKTYNDLSRMPIRSRYGAKGQAIEGYTDYRNRMWAKFEELVPRSARPDIPLVAFELFILMWVKEPRDGDNKYSAAKVPLDILQPNRKHGRGVARGIAVIDNDRDGEYADLRDQHKIRRPLDGALKKLRVRQIPSNESYAILTITEVSQ